MLDSKKTFQVPKAILLDTIKKNREKHIEEADQAKKAYRTKVINVLQKTLEDARNGEKFDLHTMVVHLPKPRSYQEEYDKMIGILEMCEETSIDITGDDFDRFVKDKWHWKRDFSATNHSYGVGRMPEPDED